MQPDHATRPDWRDAVGPAAVPVDARQLDDALVELLLELLRRDERRGGDGAAEVRETDGRGPPR